MNHESLKALINFHETLQP